jgi:hypothetical protein
LLILLNLRLSAYLLAGNGLIFPTKGPYLPAFSDKPFIWNILWFAPEMVQARLASE